jgi:DnaJ-class molecular chaperone
LSDPDKRAFYDKVGKGGMNKVPGEEEFDPREIFTKLFGGEAFYDYVSLCAGRSRARKGADI